MPFVLVGHFCPKKDILVPDPSCEGTSFLGGEWRSGVVQCNVYRECGISCAKMAKLILMPFVMLSGVGQRNPVLDGCAQCPRLANMVE